ncbi:MAG: YcjF family protein [Pseudolabrys sp.]
MAHKSSASSDTGEAIAADTSETREEMASKLVDRFALWSGVAGLIPVPVVDVFAVGGLQIQMVRRLSQIYDVEFSENRGKALIASLAGSMIPATSGIGAASVLKAVPIIGTIAGGFVMPALSAGASYAIGKAFIQHFATGGTLLDFNPPDYREFIKRQRDMWDSRKNRAAKSAQESGATTTSP